MERQNSEKERGLVGVISAASAIAALGFCLVIAFWQIDAWATRTFARPQLAAALIAILDLALFAVAIALAPALSELFRRIGRIAIRGGGRAS